jgi:hypothetical protein
MDSIEIKSKSKNYIYMCKFVENNKDKRFMCDCGKEYSMFSKSNHFKSKYHINVMNILKEKENVEKLKDEIKELKT